jgi:hypothetical protein
MLVLHLIVGKPLLGTLADKVDTSVRYTRKYFLHRYQSYVISFFIALFLYSMNKTASVLKI